jgi:cytochrome b
MPQATETATVRVWDPLIRVGHWLLVAAFATAYLAEDAPEGLHAAAGYAIAITVALRLIWGLVGPRRARFADFVTGPGRVLAYLKGLATGRAERHIGHSPAGGAMIVALLVALGATAVSGMGTLAAEKGRGPLAGLVAASPAGEAGHGGHEERGETWEEIHEVAANATLLLILVHVAGVAWASLAHRENLVRAMLTGVKRA